MSERDRRTGTSRTMRAMASESVGLQYAGQLLSTWLMRRGCDQRTINQVTARRFRYGSFRPSDRAALRCDSSPTLTPYADEPLATAAD